MKAVLIVSLLSNLTTMMVQAWHAHQYHRLIHNNINAATSAKQTTQLKCSNDPHYENDDDETPHSSHRYSRRNEEYSDRLGTSSSDQNVNTHIISQLENTFSLDVILDQGLIHVSTSTASTSNNIEHKNRLPLEEWFDDTTVGVYSSEDTHNFEYSDWSESDPCVNDQCEQCEIPEDFKKPSINIDVLDYLGIQRVKPLRVNRRDDGNTGEYRI